MQTIKKATCLLRQVMLNNASPPCITATAGTRLVRTSYLNKYYKLKLPKWFYSLATIIHPLGVTWSSLSSLPIIPHCCPPREFERYLNSNVVVHSLKSTRDCKLGKPLPYLLFKLILTLLLTIKTLNNIFTFSKI